MTISLRAQSRRPVRNSASRAFSRVTTLGGAGPVAGGVRRRRSRARRSPRAVATVANRDRVEPQVRVDGAVSASSCGAGRVVTSGLGVERVALGVLAHGLVHGGLHALDVEGELGLADVDDLPRRQLQVVRLGTGLGEVRDVRPRGRRPARPARRAGRTPRRSRVCRRRSPERRSRRQQRRAEHERQESWRSALHELWMNMKMIVKTGHVRCRQAEQFRDRHGDDRTSGTRSRIRRCDGAPRRRGHEHEPDDERQQDQRDRSARTGHAPDRR